MVIVENKRTGETRILEPIIKLRPRHTKEIILTECQMASALAPIRRYDWVTYSHDGCNKGRKSALLRTLGVIPSAMPHPCWKMWKRRHQYKKEGYPSPRVLNELGLCIHPDIGII